MIGGLVLSADALWFRHRWQDARLRLDPDNGKRAYTGQSVSEIATTLGYADASGFIRAFERWCGISPNAWRKENARL